MEKKIPTEKASRNQEPPTKKNNAGKSVFFFILEMIPGNNSRTNKNNETEWMDKRNRPGFWLYSIETPEGFHLDDNDECNQKK